MAHVSIMQDGISKQTDRLELIGLEWSDWDMWEFHDGDEKPIVRYVGYYGRYFSDQTNTHRKILFTLFICCYLRVRFSRE